MAQPFTEKEFNSRFDFVVDEVFGIRPQSMNVLSGEVSARAGQYGIIQRWTNDERGNIVHQRLVEAVRLKMYGALEKLGLKGVTHEGLRKEAFEYYMEKMG